MKKIIFLFIIVSTINIYAQEAQLKKADKYFSTASYTQSAELYSTLIKEGNTDPLVLKKAADSYYFTSNFEKAEPLYKTLVESYKESIDDKYLFRYAQTLKALNKTAESSKWMRLYNKDIPEAEYKANIAKLESLKNEGDKFEIKNLPVNTSFSDFGPAFYENNLVFSTPSKNKLAKTYKWTNQPYLDLYTVKIENNIVDSVANSFSSTVNSNLHEASVTFSKDGKTIYFTRNNSQNGKRKKDKNKITNLSLFKAELIDGVWSNIQPLPFNNPAYSLMHPALNKENNRLYFASDMPGSIGSVDIFYVTIDENGSFGNPVNLGPEINTKTREQFPFISDNNVLYFASDGHIGFGLLDIFKSELIDGTFTKPTNVGLPVNTNADDFSFIVDEKNEKGFFSSNRANGKGDDDIYSFSEIKITPPKPAELLVKGLIKDTESDALIDKAVITLFDENGHKIKELTVDQTASFNFDLEKRGTYKLTVTHPDYIPAEKTFTILDDGSNTNEQTIKMQRIPKTFLEELIAEQGQPKVITDNGVLMFDLPGILFDYDKSDVRDDAKVHLDKLLAKLKRYPLIKINIGAHTDIRGSDEYNILLSQQRATSTKNYLVANGITANRISGTGYGESKPKVDCMTHECTEAEHQINRRSEFVITVNDSDKK